MVPVNAPFARPNSSASSKFSASALQLTAIMGSCARALAACMACATISLPEPVSPETRTVERRGLTSRMRCATFCMAALSPTRYLFQRFIGQRCPKQRQFLRVPVVAGGFEHAQQLWGVRIVARVLIGAELGEKYGVGQGAFWIAKHDRRQPLDPENLFESIRRVAVIERQADQHRVET